MNDVQLKEHLETVLANHDRLHAAEIRSLRESVEKAEIALNRRLESMNEFREALKDQANMMATRRDMEAQVGQIDNRLKLLEIARATVETKLLIYSGLLAVCISVVMSIMIRVLVP